MALPRLKAEFWVKAHIRICEVQGAPAFVVRRGDDTAGVVLLKVNRLDGRAYLLEPATGLDGARIWTRITKSEDEADADATIQRAIKRDPDIWVLEIEDREGRHFLTEPVG